MYIPPIKVTTKQRLEQLKRDTGGSRYVNWRNYVLKRDNHRCQWEGCNSTEKLQVHHIHKYATHLDLRYNTYNGITLCNHCHRKTYGKEGVYAIGFTKKVFLNESLIINKYFVIIV